MNRTVLLGFAWVAYAILLLWSILCVVAGAPYYFAVVFGTEINVEAVYASMNLSLYSVLLLGVPLLIRWKLRSVTWGTFAIYSFLLGMAIALRGSLLQIQGSGSLGLAIILGGVLVINIGFLFFVMHMRHLEMVWLERRQQRRDRGGGHGGK